MGCEMIRLLSASSLISSNKTRGLSAGLISAKAILEIEQITAKENKKFINQTLFLNYQKFLTEKKSIINGYEKHIIV